MRARWLSKVTRDLVLFIFGLSGIAYETMLHAGPERPTLLAVFAAMIGLPIVMRGDAKNGKEKK